MLGFFDIHLDHGGDGIVVVAQGDAVALDDIAVPARRKAAEVAETLLFDRIAAEFPLPLFMRFLMGFPPERDIVRLDPK